MLKIRCHEIHKIIPEGKDGFLSVGAKNHLRNKVKMHLLGINSKPSNKYCDKGLIVEDQSIQLYNERFFRSGQKNKTRFETEYLSGEPDLILDDRIVDIKSSWSWATFPMFIDEAQDPDYEWQVRGYMMLVGKIKAEVAFCMVDTPGELIGFEPEELHQADHVDINRRVTVCTYERDFEKEDRIEKKCRAAIRYMDDLIKQVKGDQS